MAKVSVVIPVYNVEKLLRRCVDSVLNQTLKDIEIILVNDGSTDNSSLILEEYRKHENIKIINQKNSGLLTKRGISFTEMPTPLLWLLSLFCAIIPKCNLVGLCSLLFWLVIYLL